jgi:KaiC/GvpD/RAD55 family RecA-like ATPase
MMPPMPPPPDGPESFSPADEKLSNPSDDRRQGPSFASLLEAADAPVPQIVAAPGSFPVPLDLRELLAGDPPTVEHIIDPLVPAGKLVGIVAKRGEGKSLLSLALAGAGATGEAFLDQPAGPPVHVVYIDMEMGPEDVYDRLPDLGHGADSPTFDRLVDHLHYYQLPALPPLDTETGGIMLEAIVQRHGARMVIIDTVSRVISGRENDSEPFRDLFRHTETRLKRMGVAVVRLDHFGKDTERGSRGHSAKEDPLDIVWELKVDGETLTLKRTKGRQAGTPEQVVLRRIDINGRLRHVMVRDGIAPKAKEVAALLDQLGVPESASITEAQDALKGADRGQRRQVVADAVKHRRGRQTGSSQAPELPSGTNTRNQPGTAPELPGTTGNAYPELQVPPIGGTVSEARPETEWIDCPGCGELTVHPGEICLPCERAA